MKQFEKWWLKFEPQINPDLYNGDEKKIRKAVARCTHRTTLQWVQAEFGLSLIASNAIREELLEE